MEDEEKGATGGYPLPSTDIRRNAGVRRDAGTSQGRKKKEKVSEEEYLAKQEEKKLAARLQFAGRINKAILENMKAANDKKSFTMPERSGSVAKEPIERIDFTVPSDKNFRIQVRIANALLAHFDGTEIQVAINESKTRIYIASNKDKINEELSANIRSFDDILTYCKRNLDQPPPETYGPSQTSRLLRHSQKLLRNHLGVDIANATITVPEADPDKGDGIHAELRNAEAISKEGNTETWHIAGTKVPCIACTITLKTINENVDIALYVTPDYIGMLFLNQADSYTSLKIFIAPKDDKENTENYIKNEAKRITDKLLSLVEEHIPKEKGTMRNVEIRAGQESLQPSFPDSESDADDYTSGPIVRTTANMKRPSLTR